MELCVCETPSFTLKLSASAVNQGSEIGWQRKSWQQPVTNSAYLRRSWHFKAVIKWNDQRHSVLHWKVYSFCVCVCVCVLVDQVKLKLNSIFQYVCVCFDLCIYLVETASFMLSFIFLQWCRINWVISSIFWVHGKHLEWDTDLFVFTM